MEVIKDFQDIYHEEVDFLVKNFRLDEKKGYTKNFALGKVFVNEYDKQFIEPTSKLVNSVKDVILSYHKDWNITFAYSRLNKISKDTNTSDGFHDDKISGNVIFLHYPKINSPYLGGELEIENGEIIATTNGMNIILIDNPPHRVLNVTEGERFSVAFFFNRYVKNSLI